MQIFKRLGILNQISIKKIVEDIKKLLKEYDVNKLYFSNVIIYNDEDTIEVLSVELNDKLSFLLCINDGPDKIFDENEVSLLFLENINTEIIKILSKTDINSVYDKILIKNNFEIYRQDTSIIHYRKDLGGDGYTILHVFLKLNGVFCAELEDILPDDDGLPYSNINKIPAEENEIFVNFLQRIID